MIDHRLMEVILMDGYDWPAYIESGRMYYRELAITRADFVAASDQIRREVAAFGVWFRRQRAGTMTKQQLDDELAKPFDHAYSIHRPYLIGWLGRAFDTEVQG